MAACRTIFPSCLITFSLRTILSTRNIFLNYNQCVNITQKAMEKLGIPQRPKRPLTPYFKFMMSMRPKLRNENPDMKLTEITKMMAVQWSKFDEYTKKTMQQQYDSEMSVYLKEMINYEQSLTSQQRALLQEAKLKNKILEDKAKQRQKVQSLGKPKRPVSGFVLYVTQKNDSRDENMKYVDWFKQIVENWKKMSDEERKKYNDESKKLMDKYKVSMKEWEEKMIRLGHTDVVRSQGLLTVKTSKKIK